MEKKSKSNLGDKRLDSVFKTLVEGIAKRQSVKIRQVSAGRSEEVQFHRFLKNKNVTPEKLVSGNWKGTVQDFSDRHLLVISDSTMVTFREDARREELGFVSRSTDKDGFLIHSGILMDSEDGSCHGLGGVRVFQYEKPNVGKPSAKKKRKAYVQKPFEENERYKWFDVPRQAIENCPTASQYTLVGDRESDIYDLITRTTEAGWQFLYRSRVNRKLADKDDRKLHETINSWKIRYSYELDVGETRHRSGHRALMDVKYGRVGIKRPNGHPDKSLAESVETGIIEIKEDPVSVVGNEPPIHWILLTSHPLDDGSKVNQIIQWYVWRWMIEQLFRTVKSQGLDIENAELKTYHGLSNLATLALLAATLVIQLIQARDGKTQQGIGDGFDNSEADCLSALSKKLEGRTQKQKNPHSSETLAFATWVIARLGGWKGYRSERPPGPITIIKGLNRFHSIMEGYFLRI